ncbi:hypothetical protein PAXINDRAFT_157424 [Paxillus involutus ATCC 200175]|uniref:Uncharacterized protein n=1 Tax=Paxillus involutus ATCC 200175 TaxID=664439 RepID=A0A0C9TKJ0_PAXIN|nr:hypothetical protein PAXINDRAFT_157424 [Paxillus involutus ATCC 200175]
MSEIASIILILQQIEFAQGKSLYLDWGARLPQTYVMKSQKWNFVTLLYAVVRYLSFPLLILWQRELDSTSQCLVWYQIRMWGLYIYRVAMDVIMMKRIQALSLSPGPFFIASKWVQIIMVFSCIAKWASAITLLMLAIGPGRSVQTIVNEFAGTSICDTLVPNVGLLMSGNIPTFSFEVLLFVLAVGYFAADVWEHYQREQRWKVNDLVQILARDNIIYFTLNVAWTALEIANWKSDAPSFIPFYFFPRLIINVKQRNKRDHMTVFERDLRDNDIPLDTCVQENPPLRRQDGSFA